MVDQTFHDQVVGNVDVFNDFTSSSETYLTAGAAPEVDSIHRNPDMAETYERIGKDPDRFYTGGIARDIARTVRQPPVTADANREVAPGSMTTRDLARYRAIQRKPTKVDYRGLEVYGMGPPSSGGSTVGEALNILEGFSPLGATPEQKLHRYLEASKLAYADRNEYVGDPDAPDVDVPLRGLLSDGFAAERRAKIGDTALPAPQDPGDPWKYEHGHGHGGGKASADDKGRSTTHLTVADRWGNVVSYTFTIEQIGGSGIVVPDRGFLLNNELTDFNFTLDPDGSVPPNYPGPRQAPALEHGADDRLRPRAPRDRARLAGRRDDHHHRAAGARPPDRLRAQPARGGGGAAGVSAQQRDDARRAGVHQPVRRRPAGRRAGTRSTSPRRSHRARSAR